MGACRHGDKCDRRHNKPSLSQTLILLHMYQNPILGSNYDAQKTQEEFEEFYEDIFEELAKYGDIEELHVNDNVCDHMVGNVYVKYFHEDDADKALKAITGRFYAGLKSFVIHNPGKPVVAEFSPVTDFKEASCRQFESNKCDRGGHCNFMHLKGIPRETYKRLYTRKKRRDRSSSRDRRAKTSRRSRSRSRDRGDRDSRRSSRRHKSRSRSRDRDTRRRSRSRERVSRSKQDEDVYRERERDRGRTTNDIADPHHSSMEVGLF
jgi:splicing factor U2AF subunit